MAAVTLLLPRGEPATAAAVAAVAAPPGPASVEFLDADGRRTGRRRRTAPPPPLVLEAPGAGGTIANVAVTPPVRLTATPPRDAVAVRMTEAGRAARVVALAAVRAVAPTRPVSITRIGPAGPKVTLAVLAERFDDEALFLGQCRQLHARIAATVPFDAAPGAVGIVALFWRTDPAVGQLSVPQPTTQPDLIYGDRPLARALLKKAGVRSDRAIILINFNRRGGAGGDPEFPAWVANVSSTTDSWEQVAVHELGHAFGLGDEYQSPGPADIGTALEPNISAAADPTRAPWHDLVTAPRDRIPTATTDGGAAFAGQIGTFEGARYHPAALFRPAFTCMMRNTGSPFCDVCRRHILAQLGGT